jgi:hypothetical protein
MLEAPSVISPALCLAGPIQKLREMPWKTTYQPSSETRFLHMDMLLVILLPL